MPDKKVTVTSADAVDRALVLNFIRELRAQASGEEHATGLDIVAGYVKLLSPVELLLPAESDHK
tara:strand:- start:27 stop:218 length:192 start_codon:yes stop_codon:yes gene_type:complete